MMRIVLSGVETNNKGAELMLYAILQEIERKWPEAEVYIPFSHVKRDISYIKTTLNLRFTPGSKTIYKCRKIFRRLRIPVFFLPNDVYVKRADYFFDSSGFAYSDQWNLSDLTISRLESILKRLCNQGTKIVFLPQAFGPAKLNNTREMFKNISRYASLIIPRELVSYNYLKDSCLVDMNKVIQYSDFTSLVDGSFPSRYKHLKGGICIIPNLRMIDKGMISYEGYLALLRNLILESNKKSRPVYLLNHEGLKDEQLIHRCRESIGKDVEIVTRLNALEVKGLISSAYLVVTSRFHGLASSLNCCVPALATSWSHKYEELYKDYGLAGYVLPLDDNQRAIEMFSKYLDEKENKNVRNQLALAVPRIKNQAQIMWTNIWNL